jgi:flagellar biosynthesis repressor protein FlbT
MSPGLKITLKGGEKIYVNGAVLKVDRKVGIELLNDVTFLLEQHILKPEETTTPLRQLYFMVQTMLIDPALHAKALEMAKVSLSNLLSSFSDVEVLTGLVEVVKLLEAEKTLSALKKIRALYPLEQAILARGVGADGGRLKKVEREVA